MAKRNLFGRRYHVGSEAIGITLDHNRHGEFGDKLVGKKEKA